MKNEVLAGNMMKKNLPVSQNNNFPLGEEFLSGFAEEKTLSDEDKAAMLQYAREKMMEYAQNSAKNTMPSADISKILANEGNIHPEILKLILSKLMGNQTQGDYQNKLLAMRKNMQNAGTTMGSMMGREINPDAFLSGFGA